MDLRPIDFPTKMCSYENQNLNHYQILVNIKIYSLRIIHIIRCFKSLIKFFKVLFFI